MKALRILTVLLTGSVLATSYAADFTRIDQALRAGQFESALNALKQVPSDTREDLYGLLLRQGEIALGMGKAPLAEELFEKASFQMPTATEAQAGLVRALMAQGRFKDAQREAKRALKEAPGSVMLSIAVAQLENRTGQSDAALNRLKTRVSQLAPNARNDHQALLIAQVEILMERGRPQEVRTQLKDWLARHPDDADALDWLGQAEYAMGNQEEGSRLRASAAVRFHMEGNETRAASIQNWMNALSIYQPPPPPAPEVSPPAPAKPESPPPAVTQPAPVEQEATKAPPPSQPPPVIAERKAPRALPEPHFDPIRVPKGATIATGSGFIIDSGERVVTNAHVIGDAKQVSVRNGLGQVRKARVEVINKNDDLAVLRLESPYPAGWAIPRERIEEPRPGRSCFVLGYPLAGTLGTTWPALTSGLVSRTDGGQGGMMQITASLNSGNSGGPVVDDQGRLIGIVVAKLDTLKCAEKHGQIPEDVNFAIRPSLLLKTLSGLSRKLSSNASSLDKMDAESVYELMLPSVVLVVAVEG